MTPPCIFITSFHPLISRNIIGTAIPRMLRSRGYRVVVLVQAYKRGYFEEIYGMEGIEVAGVGPLPLPQVRQVLKRIAEALPHTRRAAIGRRRTLDGKLKPVALYWGVYAPLGFLGRSRSLHRLFRCMDFLFAPRRHFDDLFEQYAPSLVFSTDIQNEYDVALMQVAERRGISIVGMVRSWDNLTTRALRFLPERMLVHNTIIADEAVRYHGMPRRTITVTGIPHYDRYREGPMIERREFLHSIGADPARPLLLYIPLCDYRMSENSVDRFVLGLLAERRDLTTIVRFPPAAEVSIAGFIKPPEMIFDRPGYDYGRGVGDRDLTREDDDRYRNLLAHCDAVLMGPSTAAIDAAFFDKPIILVDFYPRPVCEEERIYEYAVEHFGRILESRGARRVKSVEEFSAAVEEALKNPARETVGRKRIREEQCQFLDGRASERVVEAVAERLRR